MRQTPTKLAPGDAVVQDRVTRVKTPTGWRVSCHICGKFFEIGYAVNVKRLMLPKYCSAECFTNGRRKRSEENAESRFWKYVEIRGYDDCWPWIGQRDARGYGRFTWRRGERTTVAHRIAYHLTNGDPEDLCVCHTCDNPPCCNPRHLWLGTRADNIADMDAKGRRRVSPRRGEQVNTAKLTKQKVLQIRASDEAATKLAQQFGVSAVQINNIRSRRHWRHV